MGKNYLTVKEYAEKYSCSTQYVYKLLQTKLQPFVVLIDGKKCIDIKALEESTKTDATNTATNIATEVANSSASTIDEELKRIIARNEELIDSLREEIKGKDAQLAQLNEKIISLFETNQRLMENNQSLQLNYQILLGDIKNVPVNEEVIQQDAREQETPEELKEEEHKKKGFFKRLFGK